jgi:hypothetical protein
MHKASLAGISIFGIVQLSRDKPAKLLALFEAARLRQGRCQRLNMLHQPIECCLNRAGALRLNQGILPETFDGRNRRLETLV